MDDVQVITELSSQLGYPTSTAQTEKRLTAIFKTDDQAVWVACLADRSVIGWIHVFRALRVESDAFAELGGFVVDEQHRGRTRSGRADARLFYQRVGFTLKKEQHIYDKELGTIV